MMSVLPSLTPQQDANSPESQSLTIFCNYPAVAGSAGQHLFAYVLEHDPDWSCASTPRAAYPKKEDQQEAAVDSTSQS